MGVRAVLAHGGAPAPPQQPLAAVATALLPLACCTPPGSAPLPLLAAPASCSAPAPALPLLLLCSRAAAPRAARATTSCPARAPTSRLTRAVARAREHRAAAAGPAHARPCAPHPCTVPLVPLRAPAPPSPRASTARAPSQASAAGLASSRGAREEGGGQCRVRGEEKRGEERGDREERGGLTGGPHRHVAPTSPKPPSKPPRWPNMTGFES